MSVSIHSVIVHHFFSIAFLLEHKMGKSEEGEKREERERTREREREREKRERERERESGRE